ncbi:MAG: imidazoleglycerol-phosphate dehydratase HisB, partial [Candidatus Delongbacteria bacterium]|nr:imidazoleglycerol-phosphate dehydratase HisB [Candidatus Delongbacteria bacterium]
YERITRETQIRMTINLDGQGQSRIDTGIGFFDHLLENFAKHGLVDLEADIKGDLHVDQHHTVEDTGIALGELIKKALGDKKGIARTGFFIFPMDESLVLSSLDLSGRPYLVFQAQFKHKRVGEFETHLTEDFFQGFSTALGANLHIRVDYGRSDHHKIEAIFKSVSRSLRMACALEPRIRDQIPSTKGTL